MNTFLETAMAGNQPVIRMTADEINCLVYAFLVDSGDPKCLSHPSVDRDETLSGFKHTAFSLCMEGRLENSPNFSKHIPRGELVDLLSKSLLYREVESHWKAGHLALNCKAGFSLLEPHVCSLEPPKTKSAPLPLTYTQRALGQSNRANIVTDGKRKVSPTSGVDGPAEKRPRRDADEMDTDCMQFRRVSGNYFVHGRSSVHWQITGNFRKEALAVETLSAARARRRRDQSQVNSGSFRSRCRSIHSIPRVVSNLTLFKVFVCAFNPVKPSILVTGYD